MKGIDHRVVENMRFIFVCYGSGVVDVKISLGYLSVAKKETSEILTSVYCFWGQVGIYVVK